MRGGKTRASIRATPEMPVEVLALERDRFIELLSESEETKKTIDEIVKVRLLENAASRRVGE
jgi:uncharacterized Fe-S cluster-containing radical SAM superfamily enzyme